MIEKDKTSIRCPVGSNKNWQSLNGFVASPFDSLAPPYKMELPVVVLICDHCGYLLQFAVGAYLRNNP